MTSIESKGVTQTEVSRATGIPVQRHERYGPQKAAKKLIAFAAHGHSLGTVAPKVSNSLETDIPVNPATSMPGRGIEPLRPLRGSGF